MPSHLRDARCVGVVLAGGSARRLGGVPKGLLEVDGERMIDRVARALRESTDALVLAANDADAQHWLDADVIVPDDSAFAGFGPLAGLHAVLAAFRRPALVVAWDMPFVTAELLRALRRRGETEPDALAVVPESEPGSLEPLCAWYAPECAEELGRALAAGERRVRDVVARLPGLRILPADDVRHFGDPARLLASINTPGELARAQGRPDPGLGE